MTLKRGYVELTFGCMFAGKTQELYRKTNRMDIINKEYLLINNKRDNRYGQDVISTHDKQQKKCICLDKLCDIINTEKYNLCSDIFIEEAQFFDDLKDFVLHSTVKDKKNVYMYALDGDFKAVAFKPIIDIIPHCNKITKLNALCKFCNDGTSAIYTHLINKNNMPENTNILIASNDTFVPLCRECFFKHN
jgi:thymidine kinase